MPALMRPGAPPVRSRSTFDCPTIRGYALTERLASGNWFDVHRARPIADLETAAADYAIKSIRPGVTDRDFARALLQREATVATSVSHANLISLLDADVTSGDPFLVFPFVPGCTLHSLSESPRKNSAPQALWYIRQGAAALAALHQAGWLHGDVKPQNLIVTAEGHVTLIDLGLARRLDSAECHTEAWLAGDAAYLPPEALCPGRQLTAAADIYALGQTLLVLLLGDAHLQLAIRPSRWDTIAQLRSQRPDVSREMASLIASMTAAEPIRRPTARELVEMLTRLEIESLMQW